MVTETTEAELRRLCAESIADLPEWDPAFGLTAAQTAYSKVASPQMMLAILNLLDGYRQGASVEAEAADEARAEIRALKARLAEHEATDDIPDFTPGNGNKARRRAAAAGIDMDASIKAGSPVALRPWKEIAEPVADADRKCHEPDCWNCEGTGRDPSGSICVLNGGLPF
jgi:hypothetical protein